MSCQWSIDLNFGGLITKLYDVEHDRVVYIEVVTDGEEVLGLNRVSDWNLTNFDLQAVTYTSGQNNYLFQGFHPEPTPGVYNQEVVRIDRSNTGGGQFYNNVLSVRMTQDWPLFRDCL